MAYDKADWHSGGDFPEGLDPECGGTHIGFFLAWVIHQRLESDELIEISGESLELVRERKMSGREFLFEECDGKFVESMLSDQGNAFAEAYYTTDDYLKNYMTCFADCEHIYKVADTWENYEFIAALVSSAYEKYSHPPEKQSRKSKWKFW